MENLNNVQEIIEKFRPIGWDCNFIAYICITIKKVEQWKKRKKNFCSKNIKNFMMN